MQTILPLEIASIELSPTPDPVTGAPGFRTDHWHVIRTWEKCAVGIARDLPKLMSAGEKLRAGDLYTRYIPGTLLKGLLVLVPWDGATTEEYAGLASQYRDAFRRAVRSGMTFLDLEASIAREQRTPSIAIDPNAAFDEVTRNGKQISVSKPGIIDVAASLAKITKAGKRLGCDLAEITGVRCEHRERAKQDLYSEVQAGDELPVVATVLCVNDEQRRAMVSHSGTPEKILLSFDNDVERAALLAAQHARQKLTFTASVTRAKPRMLFASIRPGSLGAIRADDVRAQL